MNRFAVIGNPIAHSLSPLIHESFASLTGIKLSYEKILGDDTAFEEQVSDFFKQKGKGLNVTSPFKQRAFLHAKIHTPRCRLAQAANTLWVSNGLIHADNTDGVGLLRDLTRYTSVEGANLLILGAGGAARGILNPLLDMLPHSITIAARTKEKAASLAGSMPCVRGVALKNLSGSFDVVINATPSSVTGEHIALPKGIWSSKPFCYDLAYCLDGLTPFVLDAKHWGCASVDGLGMLIEQAAESFYIWHGVRPATDGVLASLRSSQV